MVGSGFLPGPSRPVEVTVIRGLTLMSWSQTAWHERRTWPRRSRLWGTWGGAAGSPAGPRLGHAHPPLPRAAAPPEKAAALGDVELGLRHPVGLAFQVLDAAGSAFGVGATAV